jgi:riboflavin kinase/FMN adenylyltransferase
MRLVCSLPARFDRPLSIAIGNFDGLHRGHQALLAATRDSRSTRAMMFFEPLPATFFRPHQAVPRIMNLRDRVRVAETLGIEVMVRCRFDRPFSMLAPESFARDVLASGCRAGRVVVGPDFRFGHRAAGDIDDLRDFGRRFGFDVSVVETVRDENSERVSSSRLRAALSEGDLTRAERMLGRRYTISGRVVRGQSLGRDLGFPTANLRVAEPPALTGVTAVRVGGEGLVRHPGVASLGRRPTVAGRDWLLEVHLFDFEGDLYGRHLSVEFVGFIRHEAHFGSLAEMTRRMHDDAERAKELLNRRE